MTKFKPITFTPRVGGHLMTNESADDTGLANYTVKRNFRRYQDREIQREGEELFRPNTSLPLGNQPLNAPLGVTLIHNSRHPSGKNYILAATPTTIYRYVALDQPSDYVSAVGPSYYFALSGDATPYMAQSGVGTPYTVDDPGSGYFSTSQADYGTGTALYVQPPGDWVVIGTGFSALGHRWEAYDLNGYTVLNNGRDLPVSYRADDVQVTPLYELREQGVASVGTICEFSGILMAGNVAEIQDAQLTSILSLIDSGVVTAAQTGASYSGSTLATQNIGAPSGVITTSGGAFVFTNGMVGKTIRFLNGYSATITVFTGANQVTIAPFPTVPPYILAGLPFYILNGAADKIVTASGNFFLPAYVGLYMYWKNGAVRKITGYISPTQVTVDVDLPATAGGFGIQNAASYSIFETAQYINRIQWRMIWSMPSQPQRWGSIIPCSTVAGSRTVTLQYPVQSLASGNAILIPGAGALGGNLSTTITYVSYGGLTIQIADPAVATIAKAQLQRSDVTGSIIGFEDLQDDSSAILKMGVLKNALLIYRDTSIFLAAYTGLTDAPFQFKPIYTGDRTLHYRYTLIKVSSLSHMYAGKNSFYTFDLINQTPVEIPEAELVKNVFFDQATLVNENLIFAAENALTKEYFFCFPSSGADSGLCFDYVKKTVSTINSQYTAAATVKMPQAGPQIGPLDDWFVMGTSDGLVLQYGRTESPQAKWGGAQAMFNKRGQPYTCILQGGLEGLGDSFNEKDFRSYVLELSSFSGTQPVLVELLGYRNPSGAGVLLASKTMATPTGDGNLLPLFGKANYLQDRITVAGKDNPIEIKARTVEIMPTQSRGFTRQ